MSWNVYIRGYKNYLQIEKSLSNNTVDAYCRDIIKLNDFFNNEEVTKKINESVSGLLFKSKLLNCTFQTYPPIFNRSFLY